MTHDPITKGQDPKPLNGNCIPLCRAPYAPDNYSTQHTRIPLLFIMITDASPSPPAHHPANRRLVDALYARGIIDRDGRNLALEMISPADQWGIWASRLLLAIGTALTLAGVVFFFAFNWAKLSPLSKFATIETALIVCLIGACLYSLRRPNGQALLLAASVLVGVFMAVFGQIYQTGADAYQLFVMWATLTLGWTVLSKYAAQWIMWLIIANLGLVLWWSQAAEPGEDMQFMIFTYMILFNGLAVAAREYCAIIRGIPWVQARWVRLVLITPTLIIMLIPIMVAAAAPERATPAIWISASLALFGHLAAFYLYRYRDLDRHALAAVLLSLAIGLETVVFRLISETNPESYIVIFFVVGLTTLCLFAGIIGYLKAILRQGDTPHA